MRTTIAIIALLVGCLSDHAPALGVVAPPQWYVAPSGDDAAEGTSNHPWRTLGRAAQAIVPGATVHAAPGDYHENLILKLGGTKDLPVTFLSDRKWAAHIVGDVYDPAVDIQAGYVDFVNFAISDPRGAAGIQITGANGVASYDRLIGNDISDVAGPCKLGRCRPGVGLGGCGICLSDADNLGHDNEALGNRVHDIGDPLNPQNADLVHGIYIESGGDVHYPEQSAFSARLTNNLIYRVEGDGIVAWHCTSQAIIANNTIVEAGVHGILLSANSADCRIGGPGKPNDNSDVVNNIIVDSGWQTKCSVPMMNTHLCMRGDDAGGCGLVVANGANARILNNLLSHNNCAPSPSDTVLLREPGAATDLSSANLIGVDPLFRSYGASGDEDFHLRSGSPAIDHGTPLDAPSFDFDGVARPQGRTYSIGAYEYSGALHVN